jgi:hypothetical protein
MAKTPALPKPAEPEKNDKSWVPWQDRKASGKPYKCNTVHVTNSGSVKLDALFAIKMEERETGGPDATNKPEKSRILERGLNMQLVEYGINPMDLVQNPDKVMKKAIEKIRAKAAAVPE